MSDNYSLRVKLGDAEFSAEGPEETVKDAYQQFLAAITAAGTTATSTPEQKQTERPPAEVTQSLLERAFQKESDDVVSLRVLPRSDGDQQKADAAILLIYGFQEYLKMDEAPVTKLNQGLRRSGLSVKRLDRFMETHEGHYLKGGTRSGGRYQLTNTGKQWAVERLKSLFPNS